MKSYNCSLSILLLFLLLCPTVIRAASDFYRMDVGEERTFRVPYSVSSTEISTYYWSNDSPSAVEVVSSSFSSITVRVLQYQYSSVLLQLDYYRLSDGIRETYDLHIDIRKPDSSSDSTSDPASDPTSNPTPSSFIEINATNFPDANFREYLSVQNYGLDGVITENERMAIFTIDVRSTDSKSWNINTLKGIEHFVLLKTLLCSNNALTSLDLSKNTLLTHLNITGNQLTSLDLSKNTALKYLSCSNNALSSLDLSNNTALEELWCFNNQLTSLDVSENSKLTELYCYNNQLTSLNVSKNTPLKELWCYQNRIKGAEMDKLIEGLVNNNSGQDFQFFVITDVAQEENVCTSTQVSAAKAKGWTPYCMGRWNTYAYAGSDPTGINGLMMDLDINAPVFDLRGHLLKEPQKGINIIGGKKVVVK